jgi:nitroreductase
MDFSEVVRKRRMVRHFADTPVAPEVVDRILDLARHAPSAGFTQGQAFVVVTQPETRRAVAKLCGEAIYVKQGYAPFISGAPVLIVPCTSEAAYHRRYQEPDKLRPDGSEMEWLVPYWYMDIGCAVMVLLLATVDEGLSAGFAVPQDLDGLRALLGVPAEVMPMGVIPIGHRLPDQPSPSLKRGRKAQSEYVHRETWQGAPAGVGTE